MFADFDVDEEGRVYLQRISFDGYGCCNGGFAKMGADDSRLLIESVDRGTVSTSEVETLLRTYFAANANVIWRDALASHGLL